MICPAWARGPRTIEGSTATDWTVFFGAPPDGFDSERILAALPALRSFATEDRYRAELEAHPPALVTLGSDTFLVNYTSGQRTALNRFLRRRGYRIVRVRSAWLALRPDRFEDARRNGLTR